MRSAPEVKAKIESGAMNITTVAQVQVMIRQDQTQDQIKRTPNEKRDLFTAFENKTSREVKHQIAEMRGERTFSKLHLELDEEADQLWREVKTKIAHQTMGSELNCFKALLRSFLEKTTVPKSQRSISGSTRIQKPSVTIAVPRSTRRQVLARDKHECQNCGSQHALQIDHIQPRAKFGSNDPQNLRVLCRNCNLHFAVKEFGVSATRRA